LMFRFFQFYVLLVLCQFGSLGGKGPGKPKVKIYKDWRKYLKCPMCEELSKELLRRTNALRKEPEHLGFDWSEAAVVNLTETICDQLEDEGEWLTYLDIVEEKRKAKLVNKKELGECNRECMTLVDVCETVIDATQYEFSSLLYKGQLKRSALTQKVCYDESGLCPGKKISKKIKDFGSEKWKKGDSQARQMEKMMKAMPGAQMYNRDDIAAMTDGLDGGKKKKKGKKKKRKAPETYLEQATQYFEDFSEFVSDSAHQTITFILDGFNAMKESIGQLFASEESKQDL